jgi:hypothetical protein
MSLGHPVVAYATPIYAAAMPYPPPKEAAAPIAELVLAPGRIDFLFGLGARAGLRQQS